MGFRPQLRTESLDVSPSYDWLASEHAMNKRQGITVDGSGETPVDGKIILVGGTLLGQITVGGKYAPYAAGNSDGTETAVGILFETIDCTDGDVIAGMLIHGSVIEARCVGVDAAGKADLPLIVFQ